ncbi:MAG TPA: pentapeptide repeat-containing protein [Candidatus Helicobacter avicola]|nr:pentapeptide repeat-containing protein [Candidatus Helicobacter avicola]
MNELELCDSLDITYEKDILRIKHIVVIKRGRKTFISIQPKDIQTLLEEKGLNTNKEIIEHRQENGITKYYFKTRVEFVGADYQELIKAINPLIMPNDYTIRKFSHNIIFSIPNNFICIFENNVQFKFCNFEKEVVFSQCIFKKNLTIYDCDFQGKVAFIGSIFEGDFTNSNVIYHQRVSFHNANFANIPIFAATSFLNNQLVDFINTKIKLIDIAQIRNYLEKNSSTTNANLINEIRDSYRAIKNALIQQNNILDASEFHKLELYCKEIELDSTKPKKFSQEWIEWIWLYFYRLTSDHHTDLLKIIKWVIVLISSFATLLFLCRLCENPQKALSILNPYGFCLSVVYCLLVVIFMMFRETKAFDTIVLFAVVPIMWLICTAPKYILGITTLFSGKHTALENLLLATYSLLLFLLVFSLQKTARKNSIVPS